MSNKLPKGWMQTKLKNVINRISNGTTERQNKEGKGIPVTRIETISTGRINFGKVGYIRNTSKQLIEKYKLITGDILFSHINSDLHLGKTAVFDLPDNRLLHGMNLLLIRADKDIINPILLHYLFNYYRFSGIFIKIAQHAVNQSSLNQAKLKNLDIPLPPLPEQHRVVAKIEELFTKLDAGVEALKTIKAQLKGYRQAVLKYAFESKLTAKWREQNKDKLEPASMLLEKIEEARKEKGKYKEMQPVNASDLPEGWVWKRLGKIAEKINPGFPSGKHNIEKQGVPHLRPMNINIKGTVDLSKVKYVQRDVYDSLLKGDILFNNTNSPELLGKTAYIKENMNWAYSNHMTRIRINTSFLNPAWISYCIHYLFLSGFFKMNCIHHVNQASINKSFLSERVLIPIPPLHEQNKIVEEIERRFSIADEIEHTVYQSLKQAERLRQSILKKAFEGKLVPQDPTDESAVRLLERIKEEKAKYEVAAKAKKKNKRKVNKKQRGLFKNG